MTLGLGLGLGQNRRIATIDDESSVPIPAPPKRGNPTQCNRCGVRDHPRRTSPEIYIFEKKFQRFTRMTGTCHCPAVGRETDHHSQEESKKKKKKKGGAYHIIPSFSVQPELLVN